MGEGWIGVDLDGTLAEYHGFVNALTIGAPIPLMVERVKRWLEEGKDVRIFTARVDGGSAAKNMGVDQALVDIYARKEVVVKLIEDWCLEHIGKRLPVTCVKDYGMIELWDDRCIQVVKNTGMTAIDHWLAKLIKQGFEFKIEE
jgi:hypothetical protein